MMPRKCSFLLTGVIASQCVHHVSQDFHFYNILYLSSSFILSLISLSDMCNYFTELMLFCTVHKTTNRKLHAHG